MQPCRLPVGRHIDCHAQINQCHAAGDIGELTETDNSAYPAILFRYQATFVLPTHREQPIRSSFPSWNRAPTVIFERINLKSLLINFGSASNRTISRLARHKSFLDRKKLYLSSAHVLSQFTEASNVREALKNACLY